MPHWKIIIGNKTNLYYKMNVNYNQWEYIYIYTTLRCFINTIYLQNIVSTMTKEVSRRVLYIYI